MRTPIQSLQSVMGMLGCAALVMVSACSSSSSGGGGPAPVTNEAACSDAAAKFCAKFSECYPFAITVAYGDVAGCTAVIKDDCIKSLTAPSTGMTASGAQACASSFTGTSCGDITSGKTVDACIVAGKLANDAACGDNAQCQSKYCSVPDNQICGKCATRVASGAACSATGPACEIGTICVGAKCVAPAKVGESCGGSNPPCDSGSCTDGKCTASAKLGEKCSLDGKGAPTCDFYTGLFCGPKDPKNPTAGFACANIKTSSSTCGYDATTGAYTICTAGFSCKTDPGKTGTCTANAKVGEACSTDGKTAPQCGINLECVSSKCTAKDPSTCK